MSTIPWGSTPNLSVVTVNHGAIFGNAEETDQMDPVRRDLFFLCVTLDVRLPNVEGATSLAQIVIASAIGSPGSVAVFATKGGQLSVLSGSDVIQPDISCAIGNCTLAPLVLVNRTIVVQQALAI